MASLLQEILPPVRAEALRIFFGSDAREFHLRELSRLSKLGLGPWQRELAKLEGLQLIERRVDGNRRSFRANKNHPLYSDLVSIVAKTGGLRDVLNNALKNMKGISVAFVFGSLADGAGNASSDVDLMIVGDVGLRIVAPLLRHATNTIGREINPVVISRAGFSSKVKEGDAFLKNVMAAKKLFIVGGPDELAAMV
jgi:predicted nucleotidyltransferase